MKKYIVGIDIGGTTCKVGLFNLEGIFLKKWILNTNILESGKFILNDIYNSIVAQVPDLNSIYGYGFGVPGPIKDSKVLKCINIGWENYDLIPIFSELVNNDNIIIENDANVAALGESIYGASVGYKNIALITLGTGIGGGIIVEGSIVKGASGSAGEIGHLNVIKENGYLCNCGSYGCLETVASATGIKKQFMDLKLHSNKSSILDKLKTITTKNIIDAAKQDDLLALEVVDNAAYQIGYACSVLSIITNPDIVIIGGGISNAGTFLLNKIDYHFRKMIFQAVKDTKLVLAKLGNDAGIYGAASLVKTHG